MKKFNRQLIRACYSRRKLVDKYIDLHFINLEFIDSMRVDEIIQGNHV